MDARAAESDLTKKKDNWLARERASGRFYDYATVGASALLLASIGISIWLLVFENESLVI